MKKSMQNDFNARSANTSLSKNFDVAEDRKANKNESISYSKENYIEEILNLNHLELTEEDMAALDQKLDAIISYKQQLETNLNLGEESDQLVHKKFTYIAEFLEKYSQILNERLMDNMETNLVIKCNIKEILELNEANLESLYNLKAQLDQCESNTESYESTCREILNIESTIEENKLIHSRLNQELANNVTTKNFFRNLILKINSACEIKKIQNFYESYKHLDSEKRELQIKNKKYKEFLEQLLKDNEEKTNKESDLRQEIEILNSKLKEQSEMINLLRKGNNSSKGSLKYSNSLNRSDCLFDNKINEKKTDKFEEIQQANSIVNKNPSKDRKDKIIIDLNCMDYKPEIRKTESNMILASRKNTYSSVNLVNYSKSPSCRYRELGKVGSKDNIAKIKTGQNIKSRYNESSKAKGNQRLSNPKQACSISLSSVTNKTYTVFNVSECDLIQNIDQSKKNYDNESGANLKSSNKRSNARKESKKDASGNLLTSNIDDFIRRYLSKKSNLN